MNKESSQMEPRSQHQAPDKQTSGENQKKRWKENINDFLKPEENGETRGNEIKNNHAWIDVAKNRERWKATGREYATTTAAASVDSVHSGRKTPQDPIRQARHLNGVKLDEYEVAIIT